MTERSGYKPVDRLIDFAETRGLNIEIDRSRGSFVTVRIHNEGLAGENGLNDARITLYCSFIASKRGKWCGGFYLPMLGSQREYPKTGLGLRFAESNLRTLYIVAEKRTQADLYREVRERAEYEALKASIEQRGH